MNASSTTYVSGRHYQTHRPVRIEVAGGKIVATRDLAEDPAAPIGLPWIAPGFIDLQCNGYGGQEFSAASLSAERVAQIAAAQPAFGVTQFCPTVTTAAFDTIVHAMRTVDAACRAATEVDYAVAGIHLEGPYIASEDGPRGAHPLEHCRPPDWNEFARFQDAAGGRIRLVTLSPEYPQAPQFIARAVTSGVVVAIGHMAATSVQIRAAVDAGATLSTHLGNGAHRSLRRHPNYLWDQMAEDRLAASLIVDGHHLPAEVVQSLVRAKTPQRCILISDLSGLAGLPPGRYATQLCELEILDDGRLVIAGQDQLLAGASAPIGVGVANVMRFAGVDLATAVQMASHHPARLLGRSEINLRPGDAADATLFEIESSADGQVARLKITATLACGRLSMVGGKA
jgi:N-acetylglucosamine-6-phosphate deacetylase